VLSDDERARLQRLYAPALEVAGENDSPRNRSIAEHDFWAFLQLGGGGDEQASAALVRGLRSCERGPPPPGS